MPVIKGLEVRDISTELKTSVEPEKIIPLQVITIPASIERPRWRFSFDGEPVIDGDVVEISVTHNGKEIGHMTHTVEQAIEEGKELRPLIVYDPVVLTAFPK